MSRTLRFQIVFAFVMAMVACGGADSTAPSTNWIHVCHVNADCRQGLSCLCNRCTRSCDTADQCAALSGQAQCIEAEPVCPEVGKLCGLPVAPTGGAGSGGAAGSTGNGVGGTATDRTAAVEGGAGSSGSNGAGGNAARGGTGIGVAGKGPCGYPPIVFHVNPAPQTRLCVGPPYADGIGEVSLLDPAVANNTIVPSDGLDLIWGGQVQIWKEGPCVLYDDGWGCQMVKELKCAEEYALPKDDAGVPYLTFTAHPVTSLGTCSDAVQDQMKLRVAFEWQIGATIEVTASAFPVPPAPTGPNLCYELSCQIETEYCEILALDTSTRALHCLPYPEQCLQDHTCECLEQVLGAFKSCADAGMRGGTSVFH